MDSLRGFVGKLRVEGEPLEKVMRRPGFDEARFREVVEDNGRAYDEGVYRTVLADHQYAGYINRQQGEVKRLAKMERRRLPEGFDYNAVEGLRQEAKEVLTKFRPDTLGQASRLAGVNPSDVTLLVVWLDRMKKARRGGRGKSATRSDATRRGPSRDGTSRAAPARAR